MLFASFCLPFDDIPAYMEDRSYQRRKVSWHLHDLMKRDIQVVMDVHNWLKDNAVKNRDLADRHVNKRLLARKIAAEMCVRAAEGDIQACREVMDRTEGKVADIVLTGNLGEIIKALEAGRQRLIEAKTPQDVVVDGVIVTPEDQLPEPTSTDSTTTK